MESGEEALQRAISTVSQSDPLIKLLEQVKLGRMQSADAGLRAITVSWLDTYRKVVEAGGLSREALRRLDPIPRLAVLIDEGVLPHDHQAVTSLQVSYESALQRATE